MSSEEDRRGSRDADEFHAMALSSEETADENKVVGLAEEEKGDDKKLLIAFGASRGSSSEASFRIRLKIEAFLNLELLLCDACLLSRIFFLRCGSGADSHWCAGMVLVQRSWSSLGLETTFSGFFRCVCVCYPLLYCTNRCVMHCSVNVCGAGMDGDASLVQLVPMRNYGLFTNLLTTFVYIPISFAYIIPMIRWGTQVRG